MDAEFTPLPAATRVSHAALKVADLARASLFYSQVIGLHILAQHPDRVVLGAGGQAIVSLQHAAGAHPPLPSNTGLYHIAILFPDRASLARKMAQLVAQRVPFGYADHLVSEAFYLNDPDGNGIELYRDRPQHEWVWQAGQVRMANAPIDLPSFFAEGTRNGPHPAGPAVPDGTRLGHMHLRIADLPAARTFYHDALGFDLTAQMPGALFLAAGGYHHHLGMNIWESRGGQAPSEPATGLLEFSLLLPDRPALQALVERLSALGLPLHPAGPDFLIQDPSHNQIRLQSA